MSKPEIKTEPFKLYRRLTAVEIRPYVPGEPLRTSEYTIGVSDQARVEGSPKAGDYVARNVRNPRDMWILTEQYVKDNLEPMTGKTEEGY